MFSIFMETYTNSHHRNSIHFTDADMIPWDVLDWENLDWMNFNFTAIQWSSPEWLSTGWLDIVGDVGGGVSSGVCTLMSKAVQLTEALGMEGSCSCDSENGLEIVCKYSEVCTESSTGEEVCSSLNMTLGFDELAGVDNEVCMDYSRDGHPRTCFSYTIPVADTSMPPECSATYGDAACKCTIDENFCITVDCSEFEPSAKIDTCQVVGLDGAVEAQTFVLAFGTPEEVAATTDEETTEDIIDVDTSTSASLSTEGSAASMVQLSAIAAAVVSLVSVAFLQ
jgi:hypothetical protein